MGVCQANIPCSQIVKAKIETQTFINDSINKKDLPIKENKSLITEDARVCNEGIKIALPSRSFSSTKISNRNLVKMIKEHDIIKKNKKVLRKSHNTTTANKTPSTIQNYNTSNDNYNSKKINRIEINNFGVNNLNNNILIKNFGRKNKKNNSQIMLNSLISNITDKYTKNNNIDKNNVKKKILHNIDNNIKIDDIVDPKKKEKFSFENLQIEDIISEEKIHTKNNIEVVFRGSLLLVNNNGKLENRIVYCVMSRIKLKIYNDIKFFLKMKKPLFIIDLRLVKNINLIKDDYLGLCFSLLDKYTLTSKNKEQLFKWIVVLNYFSSKLKQKE